MNTASLTAAFAALGEAIAARDEALDQWRLRALEAEARLAELTDAEEPNAPDSADSAVSATTDGAPE